MKLKIKFLNLIFFIKKIWKQTVELIRCGEHIMGDEFAHKGAAAIDYRFLGDAGWDEIVAFDHTGEIWRRDLQKELGYSARKIRFRWGGARIKDRYRWAAWKGKITITGAVINDFAGRGFASSNTWPIGDSATPRATWWRISSIVDAKPPP